MHTKNGTRRILQADSSKDTADAVIVLFFKADFTLPVLCCAVLCCAVLCCAVLFKDYPL